MQDVEVKNTACLLYQHIPHYEDMPMQYIEFSEAVKIDFLFFSSIFFTLFLCLPTLF